MAFNMPREQYRLPSECHRHKGAVGPLLKTKEAGEKISAAKPPAQLQTGDRTE